MHGAREQNGIKHAADVWSTFLAKATQIAYKILTLPITARDFWALGGVMEKSAVPTTITTIFAIPIFI